MQWNQMTEWATESLDSFKNMDSVYFRQWNWVKTVNIVSKF